MANKLIARPTTNYVRKSRPRVLIWNMITPTDILRMASFISPYLHPSFQRTLFNQLI